MGQVDAADAGGRPHGEALGQRDAHGGRLQKVEELHLLAVLGAGRIAKGGPDAAVLFGDEIVVAQFSAAP
jgi:hypothetical protein